MVMRRSGAAVADGAVVGLCGVSLPLASSGEVVVEVAVGGLGLNGEAGVFGDGDVDRAVAVFDGDVAERGSAGEVDRAVAVGDGDVAGDAVEGDVAVAGAEGERADGLGGGEVGVGA